MTFVSIRFFIFIAVFLMLYKLTENNQRFQKTIIIAGSYVFYSFFSVYFALLLLAISLFTWLAGTSLYSGKKKSILASSIAINLAVLCFFKYIGLASLNDFFSKIAMPIGISFYIFEAISFLVDSYKGKLTQKYCLTDVLLYLSFFPILVSGPIMKAHEFLPQCDKEHRISLSSLESGAQRFLLGSFEKVVIADRLSVAVDAVYSAPAAYSGASLLWNSLTYTLQLFFDFAGYTNMAIGIATILGFSIKENFNLPYIASSPSDFWKRWHISLSSWITEYVYIPLGGNRRGIARTYINIMLAMLISGIWHGSTLNFVVWGGLHGIAQVIEKAIDNRSNPRTGKAPAYVSVPFTFLLVNFLWIPFRTDDIAMTILVFKRIFTNAPGITYLYSYTLIFTIALTIVEVYALLRNNGNNPISPINLRTMKGKIVIAALFILTLMLAYFGNGAFIYGAKF